MAPPVFDFSDRQAGSWEPSGTDPTAGSWRTWDEIDAAFIERWRDLAEDCRSGSPFLSPEFVIAAMNRLPDCDAPQVFACEAGGVLLGLGLFSQVGSSRRMPLPHLRSWQTPHTYGDGLLLRRGHEAAVLRAFWAALAQHGHGHAVEFPRFPLEQAGEDAWIETAGGAGVKVFQGTTWKRAALRLDHEADRSTIETVSLQRARSLRRGWKALERVGPVRFEIVRERSQIPRCLEDLLRLEDLGWKGELGTSLASLESRSRFFRDMVLAFAERRRVAFSRLLVGERAVASVAHLLAGDVVHAFKIGWDPEFERGCPGFQIKAQMAAEAAAAFPGVRLIDSCSSEGSFIEKVWPDRRTFALTMFAVGSLAKASASLVGGLRNLKRSANRLASGWWTP